MAILVRIVCERSKHLAKCASFTIEERLAHIEAQLYDASVNEVYDPDRLIG